jgi:hypothetical protein
MKVLCPKCGEEGYYTVQRRGKRQYVYIVHKDHTCYLGAYGEYVHVNKLHDLGLTNLLSNDYFQQIDSAIFRLLYPRKGEKDRRKELLEFLRKKVEEVENALKNE